MKAHSSPPLPPCSRPHGPGRDWASSAPGQHHRGLPPGRRAGAGRGCRGHRGITGVVGHDRYCPPGAPGRGYEVGRFS